MFRRDTICHFHCDIMTLAAAWLRRLKAQLPGSAAFLPAAFLTNLLPIYYSDKLQRKNCNGGSRFMSESGE